MKRRLLKKEKDENSKQRLEALQKELANLKDELNVLKLQWEKEKQAIHGVADLKKELEGARRALEDAQARGEYEKAAELQYGKIPSLEKQIAEVEAMQHDEAGKRKSITFVKMSQKKKLLKLFRVGQGFQLRNSFKVNVKNY